MYLYQYLIAGAWFASLVPFMFVMLTSRSALDFGIGIGGAALYAVSMFIFMGEFRCHKCSLHVFRMTDQDGDPGSKSCNRCGADLKDVRFRSYRKHVPPDL